MSKKEKLKTEFFQLRNDDKDFYNLYNKNEFKEWLKDYNIKFNNEETCKNCNSKEVTYNQLIMDSYCSDCGTWQEED